MNIVVVGCGKIGSMIVSSLVSEGHEVTVIDEKADVISDLTNIYDVMGVCGGGTDFEALEEAGAGDADVFVAVTDSDEVNMLSCNIAAKMGASRTIARVRKPEYNKEKNLAVMKSQLGLSMTINPELLAAHELFNILKLPSAVKLETFSNRNFEMAELILKADSGLCGMRLSDLKGRYKSNFLVCTVTRGEEVTIPTGNFELKSGDKIGIIATHLELQRTLREMGFLQKQAKNVMILGGSKIGFYLARMLTSGGNSVKIIEKQENVCEELSRTLPGAVITHGDGASQELLFEEGIRSVDAFLALTGLDEENILISIFASSQNVPKVIAKVNRDEMSAMADRLGLDCTVSPKKIVSDIVVRYARALQNSYGSNVETLYKIADGKAEALEFNVTAESEVTGIPLKDLSLKKGILIAGIIHERRPFIPNGDDEICAGDRVIVVSEQKYLSDLSEILAK